MGYGTWLTRTGSALCPGTISFRGSEIVIYWPLLYHAYNVNVTFIDINPGKLKPWQGLLYGWSEVSLRIYDINGHYMSQQELMLSNNQARFLTFIRDYCWLMRYILFKFKDRTIKNNFLNNFALQYVSNWEIIGASDIFLSLYYMFWRLTRLFLVQGVWD